MYDRKFITVLIIVICGGFWIPQIVAEDLQSPTPLLQADQSYQALRSDPVTHEVDFVVVVTPPYHCKTLKVWLPLPQSDFAQEILKSRISSFPENHQPQIVSEPEYQNRFAYFEFLNPKGAQMIRHRFRAKVWQLNWNLDPEKVISVENWPDSFKSYLIPQPVESKLDLQRILTGIEQAREGPGTELIRIMQWIEHNLTYDHVNASLQADANHAFTQRRGHCSDYHGLCSTMTRMLGCPSRVTYGLALYPKNSPSHCKMEAFIPPYGWVSFDLSETQKMIKTLSADRDLDPSTKQRLIEAARKRLQRGFRENSWLLVTRGTDYQLPKSSRRVRVVRTIYAEADGESLPDPDPANIQKREFAWMTAHHYESDRDFKLPFKDIATLDSVK